MSHLPARDRAIENHRMTSAHQHAVSGYYLYFEIAGSRFCAPVDEVEAIVELGTVHRLPLAPKGVAGTVLFRDRIAVVCELSAVMSGESNASGAGIAIVVSLPLGLIAFRVDHVSEIVPAQEVMQQTADERSMQPWMDGCRDRTSPFSRASRSCWVCSASRASMIWRGSQGVPTPGRSRPSCLR